MRKISMVLALALVAGGALTLGSPVARSSRANPPVLVSVTGSAPRGAVVRFGHDAATYPGTFPIHTRLPFSVNVSEYFVSARLKHGGKLTCTLQVGSAKKVVHVKGGHKSCLVKLTSDSRGGWH